MHTKGSNLEQEVARNLYQYKYHAEHQRYVQLHHRRSASTGPYKIGVELADEKVKQSPSRLNIYIWNDVSACSSHSFWFTEFQTLG